MTVDRITVDPPMPLRDFLSDPELRKHGARPEIEQARVGILFWLAGHSYPMLIGDVTTGGGGDDGFGNEDGEMVVGYAIVYTCGGGDVWECCQHPRASPAPPDDSWRRCDDCGTEFYITPKGEP